MWPRLAAAGRPHVFDGPHDIEWVAAADGSLRLVHVCCGLVEAGRGAADDRRRPRSSTGRRSASGPRARRSRRLTGDDSAPLTVARTTVAPAA